MRDQHPAHHHPIDDDIITHEVPQVVEEVEEVVVGEEEPMHEHAIAMLNNQSFDETTINVAEKFASERSSSIINGILVEEFANDLIKVSEGLLNSIYCCLFFLAVLRLPFFLNVILNLKWILNSKH